jgi:thiamine monophosphate kinase
MWSKQFLSLLVLVVALGACSGSGDPEQQVGRGAETAEQAVEDLFSMLAAGEFGSASNLAVPEQSALAALAEGASVADVAAGLRDGDARIASNFWSGFAQSIDSLLGQGVEVVGSSTTTTQEMDFTIVEIVTGSGDVHHIATREVDGHRVDLFATFGPSLAGRLYPQIELLFDEPSEDASFVLARMREQVPSFHMAAETPNLAPNVVQDLLQLIELITRLA